MIVDIMNTLGGFSLVGDVKC